MTSSGVIVIESAGPAVDQAPLPRRSMWIIITVVGIGIATRR